MLRLPAVSGRFYPGDAKTLRAFMDEVSSPDPAPAKALGVIVPHAGYVYSGTAAGAVFKSVAITPTVILLGPNHTGRGAAAAIYGTGAWQTPFGDAPIDERLASHLKTRSTLLTEDTQAHQFEHSLEVELDRKSVV